jgi:hypothetical protein
MADITTEYVEQNTFFWDRDSTVVSRSFTISPYGRTFFSPKPCYYCGRKAYYCRIDRRIRETLFLNCHSVKERIVNIDGLEYIIVYESELNKNTRKSDYYKLIKGKIDAYRKIIHP